MKYIRGLIDFILYSNLFVAGCIVAAVLQTQYLLTGGIHVGSFEYFVICGTLCQYSTHRVIGRINFKGDRSQYRFYVLERYYWFLLVLAIISLIAATFFFLQLSRPVQFAMILPMLIAAAYVLPMFKRRLRLRDFNYIKIFLISIIGSWITVFVVMLHYTEFDIRIFPMVAERALFFFVMILPFDIRDINFDKDKVITIPIQLGIEKTKMLGYVLLCLFAVLALMNVVTGLYQEVVLLPLILSGLILAFLLRHSSESKHDYYFSFTVDGMIIVQFLLVLLFVRIGE